MKIKSILNSATMGQPRRLRPMILWTMAEFFFRGAPYGAIVVVLWEIFKPLADPSLALNTTPIIWACVGTLISLIILYFLSRKAFLASYIDGYDICCDGRLAVIDRLRRLPMGFYNKRDPGDIGAYIVSDYINVETLTTHILPQFFGAITMPIIALASMAFFSWKLTLAAALVIPLTYPLVLLTNRFVAYMGKKHQKVKVETASRMIEYIQGIRLIKAFNLGGDKFLRLEKAFRNLKRESIRLEAAPAPTVVLGSLLLNGGLVLIMLAGFAMLLKAEVSLPVYIMFLLVGTAIYQPLIHAMTFMALMNYMKLGAERVDELRQSPLLPEGTLPEPTTHDITFRDVHFRYNDVDVINGISFRIPDKGLTALVGPSGSGKTTLTRLIARFWDVDRGEILLSGNNLREYTADALMSQISIVFQDVYLFNDTIYNNIRIGKEDAGEEEIVAAARAACCHDFITALPNGYQTMVGEGGSTLSGGEKQRISIARAILKNAPIVLLDEATASLDPENELHIQQAINELVKNRTVVVIAHRLNTVKDADNIVVLDKGMITEQGKHHELLQNKGLYYEMWQEQQRVKGWKF